MKKDKPNSDSPTSKKTFKKRRETTDKGKIYEDFTLVNLILHLLKNENVKNFNIWSNDDQFGAFDNVIVEAETENKTLKYAFQLKHVQQKQKQLSLRSLTASSGDFSIQNYFKSFQTYKNALSDFKLFLLTNLHFEIRRNEPLQLPIGEAVPKLGLIRTDLNPTFDSDSSTKNCYKFQMLEGSSSKEYEEFFEKFFLITNQMHVDDLKAHIGEQMKATFSCDDSVVDKFLKFVTEWSLLEGSQETLQKEVIEQLITLHLVDSSIYPIAFGAVNSNGKLLQEVVSDFKVTVFDREFVESVRRIYGDAECEADEEEINVVKKRYQITFDKDSRDKGYSKLLWLMDKCPLIVDGSSLVHEAIKLCKNKKFVVVGENPQVLGFRKLSHLNKEKQEKLLEDFKCLVAGKEVSVGNLIQEDDNFQDIITTDDLLSMAEGLYEIKQEEEETPDPYISRRLSKQMFKLEILEILKDSLVVISNITKLKKYDSTNVEEFLENGTSKEESNIFVSRATCSEENLRKILSKRDFSKTLHHFRMSNGCLEWLKSENGTCVDLERYRAKDQFLPEPDLWDLNSENNIHIITADPGIGKSSLLKNLKNNFSSKILTILFTPQDIIEICDFFKKSDNIELEEFIINLKFPNHKKFDKSVLQLLLEKNDVVFLWDALDEITSDGNMKIILTCIERFSQKGIVQWMTCRCHLQNALERRFNVLAKTILRFCEEQQYEYMEKRLKTICSDSDLQDVITKIKNNVVLSKYKDILSLPLQIYMLTELCIKDKEKYLDLLKQVFSLTDLYQHFVEEKFNFFYQDKLKVDVEYTSQLKPTQKVHVRQFEKVALGTILEPEFLTELNLDFDEEEESDCFGFVTVSGDKSIKFSHISYAEYFVASYFVRRKTPTLKKILFKEKYTNVRYFFDMLLAKNSPAHLAILHRNLSDLQKFDLRCKDLGGRNVLQLACSWGERYPLLKCSKSGDNQILQDRGCAEKQESKELLETIEHLSKTCDVFEKDQIFDMNALEYAEKSECLLCLTAVVNQKGLDYFKTKEDDFNCTVLYFSVRLGIDRFILLFDKYLKSFRTQDNKTLLHLAQLNQNHKLVEVLLSRDLDSNVTDDDGMTPLQIACILKNEKSANLLVRSGASVDSTDNRGMTPLHTAAYGGNVEVAKLLVKYGNVDAKMQKFGLTALHLACCIGYYDFSKDLICTGAEVDAIDSEKVTVYFSTREYNRYKKVVEVLIQHGADINATSSTGFTPLHLSCEKGCLEIVDFLIKSGASIKSVTDSGMTLLHSAVFSNNDKITELLLQLKIDVDACNADGRTALHLACLERNEKTVDVLIKFQANINASDRDGFTPLHLVIGQGHQNLTLLLINSGGDINACSKDFWTPLHLAALGEHNQLCENTIQWQNVLAHGGTFKMVPKKGLFEMLNIVGIDIHVINNYGKANFNFLTLAPFDEIVDLLIQRGANVNARNSNGWTPLHIASENGYKSVVEVLIQHTFDINASNSNGWTALHLASFKGHLKIVEFLIKSGSVINCLTCAAMTPLYLASLQGHTEVVKFLIGFGADVDQPNEYGTTPLIIACCWGNYDVVDLLLSSGADMDITDYNGLTPLGAAVHNNQKKVVDLLIQRGCDSCEVESLSTPLYVVSELGNFQAVESFLGMGASVERCGYNGWRALHVACFKGYEEIVRRLLEEGARVDVCTFGGDFPVDLARENGHMEIVSLINGHKDN